MFIYPYIFFGSLILIVGMIVARLLYKKLHDHDDHLYHRMVSWRARKVNVRLKGGYKKFRRFLRYFNRRTFALLVHLVIEEVEEWFHKVAEFLKEKFPHNPHHK